jgi:hypothetical protein
MKIRNTGRFLFLLQQNAELPESIKPMTYVVLSMFPDDGELKALVTPLLDGKSTDGTAINRLIDSLKGMSLTEVDARRGSSNLYPPTTRWPSLAVSTSSRSGSANAAACFPPRPGRKTSRGRGGCC